MTDYGWGPRKVLVANRGQNAAMFTVLYESALLTKLSACFVILSLMFTYL